VKLSRAVKLRQKLEYWSPASTGILLRFHVHFKETLQMSKISYIRICWTFEFEIFLREVPLKNINKFSYGKSCLKTFRLSRASQINFPMGSPA
jgi:hypothetical protein